MENEIVRDADPSEGLAALSICESLLLALTDLKVIGEQDARDLLTDVVARHTEAFARLGRLPQRRFRSAR